MFRDNYIHFRHQNLFVYRDLWLHSQELNFAFQKWDNSMSPLSQVTAWDLGGTKRPGRVWGAVYFKTDSQNKWTIQCFLPRIAGLNLNFLFPIASVLHLLRNSFPITYTLNSQTSNSALTFSSSSMLQIIWAHVVKISTARDLVRIP